MGERATAVDPTGGDQPTPTRPKRWYRRPWVLLLVGATVLAVAIVLWGYLKPGPNRIQAAPPAATPAGYRLVTTKEYELAIPRPWVSREIDTLTREGLAGRPDTKGAGSVIAASDRATGDAVDVVPFVAIDGDPTDPASLARLQRVFARQYAAQLSGAPDVVAVDVHGFPAARVRIDAGSESPPFTLIATVIHTGDHVYRIAIGSRSGERAVELTRRIVPTFSPR
jgi:hypothetical protein